jgi:quinol monooxygenase YgiN
MPAQFVTATYRVKQNNLEAFILLMKEAEQVMRSEQLITSKPVLRMQSRINPEYVLEVFEWVDEEAFGRAQQTPKVLAIWGQYQNIWEAGGFGMNQIPESSESWAQYSSL